ncbi:hypothetical protein [Paramagnetospirillum marisnigri]|uniref:hypothetical protein n=1 Tax=Paramagnetospirillum marisnigri TaxID=1285242 RepID=UPI000AA2CCB6|nr:hypothetical protein [Paramagnetospirillum marisnigri]
MHANQANSRQCADCYYRVGTRCAAAEAEEARAKNGSDGYCERFIRASLRFAFFPKM